MMTLQTIVIFIYEESFSDTEQQKYGEYSLESLMSRLFIAFPSLIARESWN